MSYIYIYLKETCLSQTSILGPAFCFWNRQVFAILHIKLAKISFIETLFNVQFKDYSGLLKVRFRRVSHNSRHDIAEILLTLALNTNQSTISQILKFESINKVRIHISHL